MKMKRYEKSQIKKEVTKLVETLREKYKNDLSIDGLRKIVEKELNIHCNEFSSFELGYPYCAFDENNSPTRIAYCGLLPITKRYILAHEMGHAFLGRQKNLRKDEFKADEFATQITGIPKWKSNLLIISDAACSGVSFFPQMIIEIAKETYKNYSTKLARINYLK